MTAPKIAIVWRGDREARRTATPANSRFHRVFEELAAIGIDAEPAVYDEEFADEVRAQLLQTDGVLVWVNPLQDGIKTREALDPLLREIAERGPWVSAHPDVILNGVGAGYRVCSPNRHPPRAVVRPALRGPVARHDPWQLHDGDRVRPRHPDHGHSRAPVRSGSAADAGRHPMAGDSGRYTGRVAQRADADRQFDAATGLVSLPGMMTGQILSGVPPVEAVQYQILVMFLIAGGTGFGAVAAVLGGVHRLTDARHRLRLDRLERARPA
jgi:hypothetical protein